MRTLTNFLIITFILSFSFVSAQLGETCAQNLSIFVESAKVKNYDAAYDPWISVRYECPKASLAIYNYGERILKNRIKKSEGAARQQEVKDLMKLYDQWIQNFPIKKGKSAVGSILASKAQTMITYKIGTPKEVYDTFDKAFTEDIASFTNPRGLYNYFKTMYDLYKSRASGVTPEKLFNKYEEVSEKFELEGTKLSMKLDVILKKEADGNRMSNKDLKDKKKFDTNSKAIGIFLSNLDAIISKESSCENLIPLYQRNFEENKGDAVWLNRAASRMKTKECSDDPLFVTIVEALHALAPSANSAYYLGILNDKRGDNNEALRYYEESISLETDPYKKAKTLYKIALEFKARGRKSTARNYANKALKYQPSLGKAHLMIASLYASSANDCGNTQFEKRAVYWLAAKVARKAGKVEASLKKNAEKAAQSYEGRAPTKTDIFTEGNAGTSIKFNCWIRASVTVPNL